MNTMRKTVSGLCLGLLMMGAAQAGLEESGVRIGTGDSENGLVVTVSGKQAGYRVDEPIVLSIRGNKTFFLWAFTEDDNDNAIVLVPSRHQSGNKYEAGRNYRLPNPGLNFFADAPGSHLITLVASTRWLDIDRWLNERGRTMGAFTEVSAQALTERFAEQGVGIRPNPPGGGDGGGGGGGGGSTAARTVIRHLSIEVR